MDVVMAMPLTMARACIAVAKTFAISITHHVHHSQTRPLFPTAAWTLSQQDSPHNAADELTKRTEHLMIMIKYQGLLPKKLS